MKKVYSLGGGCWVNNDIPQEIRLDSVFKSFYITNTSIFFPLELFNGNLEKEFLQKDGNWDMINVNDTYECRQIQKRKQEDPIYVSNYLLTYDIQNKNIGWVIAHPHQWKSNPTNKYTFKEMFDSFKKNRDNLLYIVDFQRGGYQDYTNERILEFEKFLDEHGYDFKDFIYLDVNTSENKSRFENSRIPLFIQTSPEVEDEEHQFHNTKAFFEQHMDYVNEQLTREG